MLDVDFDLNLNLIGACLATALRAAEGELERRRQHTRWHTLPWVLQPNKRQIGVKYRTFGGGHGAAGGGREGRRQQRGRP